MMEPSGESIDYPSVLISIVAYNTLEDLRSCIDSICSQHYSGAFRVVIWNNGDRLPDDFCSDGRVTIREPGENVGFGAGHNRNVNNSSDQFVLILNPDTILPPHALGKLVNVWRGVRGPIGALVPQLVDLQGDPERSCRRFPTLSSELARSVGLDHWKGRGTVMADWSHTGMRAVPQPPGAAIFLECETYRRLGGFDEQFFLYFEDVDLCKRIWGVGPIWFTDSVQILHSREGTARRYRDKAIFWIEWSRRQYLRKHLTPGAANLALVCGWGGVVLRSLYFGLKGLVVPNDAESRKRAKGYSLVLVSSLHGSPQDWRRRMR